MNTKKRKKVWFIGGAILILLLPAAGFVCFVVEPSFWKYPLAWDAIARIEGFKLLQGRLPADMGEIAPAYNTGSGPIYYERVDADRYIVWFGLETGESMSFESSTKTWSRFIDEGCRLTADPEAYV